MSGVTPPEPAVSSEARGRVAHVQIRAGGSEHLDGVAIVLVRRIMQRRHPAFYNLAYAAQLILGEERVHTDHRTVHVAPALLDGALAVNSHSWATSLRQRRMSPWQ